MFEGLATEEYQLDVRQLTPDQAKMYLSLVQMAGHFLEVTIANPSVAMAFPEVVAKGLERVYYRLSSMKPLFEGILAELQDEAVIRQIENLLTPKTDFWNELSQKEKSRIKKGLEQLDKGERVEYKAFLANRS